MRIGSYELLGSLGSGGSGSVVRARGRDGREVAIKLLRRPDSKPALARFERERRLLDQLGLAQGFVPLLDSGESAEGPWFVMPLLAGGTLRDRLEKTPRLSIEETVALGRAIALACGKAHDLGVVHRDLKPENILYARPGNLPPSRESAGFDDGSLPLVADVGLAKHFRLDTPGASASVALTRGGVFVGTAAYVPPEQFRGARDVGPSADVFAVGAILYECLTGQPAFEGQTLEQIFHATQRGLATSVRTLRPEVPAALAASIERALQVDPARRFVDGHELARALGGEAPPGAPGPNLRPALAALVAVALVALVLSGLLVRRIASRPAPGLDRETAIALLPRFAELDDSEAAHVLATLAPGGRVGDDVAHELTERLVQRGRRALEQGETARALVALDRPNVPARSSERALVLALAGRFGEAIAAAPDETSGRRFAGRIALASGDAALAGAALGALPSPVRGEDCALARALARAAGREPAPFPPLRAAGASPDPVEGATRLLDLARVQLAAGRPWKGARAEEVGLASLPPSVAGTLRVARARLALTRLDAAAAATELAPLLENGPVTPELAFEQAQAHALATEIAAASSEGASLLPARVRTPEALLEAGRRRFLDLPRREREAAHATLGALAVGSAEEVVGAADRSGERRAARIAVAATSLALAFAPGSSRAHELEARAQLLLVEIDPAVAAASSAVALAAGDAETAAAALVLARARLARVEAALDEGLLLLVEGKLPPTALVLRPLADEAVASAERAVAAAPSPEARLALGRAKVARLLADEPPTTPAAVTQAVDSVRAALGPLLAPVPIAELAAAVNARDRAVDQGDAPAAIAATHALDALVSRANAGDPVVASLAVEALGVLARARAAVSLDEPSDEGAAFEALALDGPARAEARKRALVRLMNATFDPELRCPWSRLLTREEVQEIRRLGPDLGVTLFEASNAFEFFLGTEWTDAALETPGEVPFLLLLQVRFRKMLDSPLATQSTPSAISTPYVKAADEVVNAGESANPDSIELVESSAQKAPGDPVRLFFRAHARTGAFATRDLELATLGAPEARGLRVEVFRRIAPDRRLRLGLDLLTAGWVPRPEDIARLDVPAFRALANARGDPALLLKEAQKLAREPGLAEAGLARLALLSAARLGQAQLAQARAAVAGSPDDAIALALCATLDDAGAQTPHVRAFERARLAIRPVGDLRPLARARASRTSFIQAGEFVDDYLEQERLDALAWPITKVHQMAPTRPGIGFVLARRPDRDVAWLPTSAPQDSYLEALACREHIWAWRGPRVARALVASLRGYTLNPYGWTPTIMEDAAAKARAVRGHADDFDRYARTYRSLVEALEAAGEAPFAHTSDRR